MNLYFKRRDEPRHIEVIELADGFWVSITKKLNKVGDPMFEIYKVEHNEADYDESAWWKNSQFHIDKNEFDSLKNELFDWVDNTFKIKINLNEKEN